MNELAEPIEEMTAVPMRKIWVDTITLKGVRRKRATVYSIPGYTGPELAVVEYASPNKMYQPKAYSVYVATTGRIVDDSSGILPLPLLLQNATERMQQRERILAKRRKVGTGPHAKYGKSPSNRSVKSLVMLGGMK
jgi:hypothetical protein